MKDKLLQLKRFLEGDHSEEDVIEWISNCVAFFSSIGVAESIIVAFMHTFYDEGPRSSDPNIIDFTNRIGPFVNRCGLSFSLTKDMIGTRNDRKKIIFIDIAFKTAEDIIDDMEESERLIPKALISFFEQKTQYSHISASLRLMEQNFKNNNSDGLLKDALTLLDSVLDCEPQLCSYKISIKLRQLQTDSALLNKFGVRKEIITALDNSRLLRNQLSVHKNIPLEYNIPLAVSLGAAYLVILTLQITMATGNVIK